MNTQHKPCRKCGGVIDEGHAIVVDQIITMGVPDFPGATVDTIGQTCYFVPGDVHLIPCYKCKSCGHSFTKDKS